MKRKEHRDGLKHCSKCDTWRPLSDYHKNARNWDGLHAHCRPCMAASAAARYDRERVRLLKLARAWREQHPDKRKDFALRRKFGMPLEAYRALEAKQEGRCAICSREADVLHVDHDHATAQVRGLLCMPCNTALGSLGDDPERLRRAALYLEGKL